MKDKKDNKELQKVLDRIANGINSSEVFKKTMKKIEKSKNKKRGKYETVSNMEQNYGLYL